MAKTEKTELEQWSQKVELYSNVIESIKTLIELDYDLGNEINIIGPELQSHLIEALGKAQVFRIRAKKMQEFYSLEKIERSQI